MKTIAFAGFKVPAGGTWVVLKMCRLFNSKYDLS